MVEDALLKYISSDRDRGDRAVAQDIIAWQGSILTPDFLV
jgi:hypothetical protein